MVCPMTRCTAERSFTEYEPYTAALKNFFGINHVAEKIEFGIDYGNCMKDRLEHGQSSEVCLASDRF